MLEERYPHERPAASVRLGLLSGNYIGTRAVRTSITLRLLRPTSRLLTDFLERLARCCKAGCSQNEFLLEILSPTNLQIGCWIGSELLGLVRKDTFLIADLQKLRNDADRNFGGSVIADRFSHRTKERTDLLF